MIPDLLKIIGAIDGPNRAKKMGASEKGVNKKQKGKRATVPLERDNKKLVRVKTRELLDDRLSRSFRNTNDDDSSSTMLLVTKEVMVVWHN